MRRVADTEIGIREHGNDLGAAGDSGRPLTIGGGDIAHVPGGVTGSPRKAIHEIKKQGDLGGNSAEIALRWPREVCLAILLSLIFVS